MSALLLVALEGLLEHARPANLAELQEDDNEQFEAWTLAERAVQAAKDEAALDPALVELAGKLRSLCA